MGIYLNMGPKPAVIDTEMKKFMLKVVGGEAPSNAVLSGKLAPFGCNPKKAGEEILKNTKEYTNIRIFIRLSIQAREIKQVEILPMCSSYIIKELKEPIRQRRKVKGAVYKHTGNLTFEQVKNIAKKMKDKTLSRDFKGTVKETLGTCLAADVQLMEKTLKKSQLQLNLVNSLFK